MGNEKTSAKKTFAVIGNVIIWLFVIFAIIVTMLTLAATSSSEGVPSIGGKTILTVYTNSMKPTFVAGDIIIGDKLSPDEAKSLKVGDVITYDAGDLDGDGVRDFNSHRIVEIINGEDGKVSYVTRGDNIETNFANDDPVDSQDVICKYSETRIKGVGNVLAFLQTQTGFLCVIVLPLVLFFIFELIRFVRRYTQIKNEGKVQITAEDEERIRKQAVEEYLRSQGQGNAADEPAEAEAAPAEESAAVEPAEAKAVPAEESAAVEPAEAEAAPAEDTAAEEPTEDAAKPDEGSAET